MPDIMARVWSWETGEVMVSPPNVHARRHRHHQN
jgi:hypothetical protein